MNKNKRKIKLAGVTTVVLALFTTWYFNGLHTNNKANRDSQAEAAINIPLRTITRSSTILSKAIHASNLADLKNKLGSQCSFEGVLLQVFSTPKGGITLLNFAPTPTDAAEAVVSRPDYNKFPKLSNLIGKRLLVSGKLEEFENDRGEKILEIKISSPDQLSIVSN